MWQSTSRAFLRSLNHRRSEHRIETSLSEAQEVSTNPRTCADLGQRTFARPFVKNCLLLHLKRRRRQRSRVR